jgi:acylphosphatase
MALVARSISLCGKVQQVGFRYFVYRLACELGVKGFVKNLPDGSVLIEAECDEHLMEVFISHVKKGSPHSNINGCESDRIEVKNYKEFKIL